MHQRGKAIIFSAPSGAGKTTIVKRLLASIAELRFSVSATTRSPRSGEAPDKDYHFISVEDFKEKIREGAFYEWEEVYKDLYYGTLRSEVQQIWQDGKHVIFDIDVIGGINLKKAFGDKALAIFVEVRDIEILRERLKSRSTEKHQDIEMRVKKAQEEMKKAIEFDCILRNDQLEKAVEEAEKIVTKFIHE